MKEKTLRKLMETNVRAYNSAVTDSYLSNKTLEELLPHTHSSDRDGFDYQIRKLRKEQEEEEN